MEFGSSSKLSNSQLTSSIVMFQSLSSYSEVRGSLKTVTKISRVSGTGQTIIPFIGFFIVGSHSFGSTTTRRLRLQRVKPSFFGCL